MLSVQAERKILHASASTSIPRVVDDSKLGCVRVEALKSPCVE